MAAVDPLVGFDAEIGDDREDHADQETDWWKGYRAEEVTQEGHIEQRDLQGDGQRDRADHRHVAAIADLPDREALAADGQLPSVRGP